MCHDLASHLHADKLNSAIHSSVVNALISQRYVNIIALLIRWILEHFCYQRQLCLLSEFFLGSVEWPMGFLY